MKITDVEAMVLDTGKDYANPKKAEEVHGVRYISLLKIITDEGITGWSDIETQPHVGKIVVDAPSGGEIGFESVKSALIGEDPLQREKLWQKMYRYLGYYGRSGVGMHMISGADIALWDIAGKALNQPLYRLLGAKYHNKIKGYASTLFRAKPDDIKKAVNYYLKKGFKAIKFGWGAFGYDVKLDILLVKAAREEAGADVDIMVDGGWYGSKDGDPFKTRSIKDWTKLIRKLEEFNVFWLEDFIHPENIEGYARVSNITTTLKVASGEQCSGVYEFERLANDGKVDVLQPDLSRCGGLTIGKQIADFSMRKQIDCAPHAWLTDILKAASLHLNAYLINPLYLEYNVASGSLLNNLCKNKIRMEKGFIEVPDGYGLGVEIDEKIIKKYRVL